MRRASSSTSARIAAMSVEVLRVGLFAADRLALLVGIDGALVARRRRAGAATRPSCRRRAGALPPAPSRTSTRRAMPAARSLPAVTGPTPQSASTGSSWRKRSTRSGAMTVRPSGFFQPDAIFARNLFGATPAEAVSRVSSRICAFRRRATSTPSGSPQAFSVTSRYASSSESGSTSGVTARKIAKTCCETARVLLEVRPQDHEVRAQAHGARHRDGRAHAEGRAPRSSRPRRRRGSRAARRRRPAFP